MATLGSALRLSPYQFHAPAAPAARSHCAGVEAGTTSATATRRSDRKSRAAASALAVGAVLHGVRCGRRRGQAVARSALKKAVNKKGVDIVPKELEDTEHAGELAAAMDAMHEAIHISLLCVLVMQDATDTSAVGLHGFEIEQKFVRNRLDGSVCCITDLAVLATIAKFLTDKYPDIPILSDEDVSLVDKDPEFGAAITSALATYMRQEPKPSLDDVKKWLGHTDTFEAREKADGKLPDLYWAVLPLDSTDDYRNRKMFSINIALMKNNKPVLGLLGCPDMAFDHPIRTGPNTNACPIFFAMEGHGAYTQLVSRVLDMGVYLGRSMFKGYALPLQIWEKIGLRGRPDDLFGALGVEQLKIGFMTRRREDVVEDCRAIAKELGSEYPQLEMVNGAAKYALLVRGNLDICWWFPEGLYNKDPTELLNQHAAGGLLIQESGGALMDLDGKPIDWSSKALKCRGMLAMDPKKVAPQGVVKAVEAATVRSEQAYDERCERRKQVALDLAGIFKHMEKIVDEEGTDEEKKNCAKVMEISAGMLSDDKEMMQMAQDSLNRERPILGVAPERGDNVKFPDGPRG